MAAKLQPDLGQPAARVLAVENCPATSVFICQALKRAGIEVTVAATGARALELAVQEPFDLVILDLSAPSMQAIEVCRALRKEPATRDVPLVFLAGWDTNKATVDEARQFGMTDVVCKPLQTLEFLARILGSLRQQARHPADVLDWVANR